MTATQTFVHRMLLAATLVVSTTALWLPMRVQTFTRVPVAGHDMRLLIGGKSRPTVVFESGAGPTLEMWGKVLPQVSRFARTVAYDRAGVGLSEHGPSPRDGRQIAVELRQALRAAGVRPPFVLVGASLGGLYVRVFAGMYPEDVSGMVLVDPTPDSAGTEVARHPELAVLRETAAQARMSLVPSGVRLVLIDAVSPIEVPFATPGIRRLREKNLPESEAESRAYQAWLDTVPGARLVMTRDSGHNVPIEQPQLVIDTIRQVIDDARQ